jgi:hypothetical protein
MSASFLREKEDYQKLILEQGIFYALEKYSDICYIFY